MPTRRDIGLVYDGCGKWDDSRHVTRTRRIRYNLICPLDVAVSLPSTVPVGVIDLPFALFRALDEFVGGLREQPHCSVAPPHALPVIKQ
jgi:hypothetical protein